MSERLKSTSKVSNEEVIEDLTKDLQTLSTEHSQGSNPEKFDEFVIDPEHSSADISPMQEQPEFKTEPPQGSDTEKDGEGNVIYRSKYKTEESDTESIDEEKLKDIEVDLTAAQKEERRKQAEEFKLEGNRMFMDGEYDPSAFKYTEALRICPLQFSQQRAILYCNRSAARLKLERYNLARRDCDKAIELDDKYLKAYVRRAQAYEALEKYDESLADYKKVLELDPSHKDAMRATQRLPGLIEEKNEKLKTEMLGKLKDLGNMILKPFGLSTENFQLEQDPESKDKRWHDAGGDGKCAKLAAAVGQVGSSVAAPATGDTACDSAAAARDAAAADGADAGPDAEGRDATYGAAALARGRSSAVGAVTVDTRFAVDDRALDRFLQ